MIFLCGVPGDFPPVGFVAIATSRKSLCLRSCRALAETLHARDVAYKDVKCASLLLVEDRPLTSATPLRTTTFSV
jgi:hypothetical protein